MAKMVNFVLHLFFTIVFTYLVEIQLIYNVSNVQQSDSEYIYIYTYVCIYIYFFFRFFSIIGYYMILNRVPYAVQQDLVVYLFYV